MLRPCVVFVVFITFTLCAKANENNVRSTYRIPTGFGMAGVNVQVVPEKAMRRKGISMQKYDYSCGSAALTTMVNQQLGLRLGESEVIEGLLNFGETEKIKSGRRFSLLDMKRYLASIDILSAGYSAKLDDLSEIPVPAIMSIVIKGFRHFVVYQGLVDGHVVISDPAFGNMSITLSKFSDLWKQKIFFIISDRSALPLSGNSLSNEKLRFVSERTFFFDVLRHTSSDQNKLSYYLQVKSAFESGVFKSEIR